MTHEFDKIVDIPTYIIYQLLSVKFAMCIKNG